MEPVTAPTSLTQSHLSLQGVLQLKSHGADVALVDFLGWAPLHAASAAGHCDAAEELLNLGAEINRKTYHGFTSVYVAAQVIPAKKKPMVI